LASKVEYSIAIPANNEESVLEKTVTDLASVFSKSSDVEILIVNNCSTDKTAEVATKLQNLFSFVRVCDTTNRLGYGVAVKTAIADAKGKYIVFVMADGSELPDDVDRMIQASRANPNSYIFGNRFDKKSVVSGYPRVKRVLNLSANFLISLLFQTNSRDLTNGFKLFIREPLLPHIPKLADDFSVTLQLSMLVLRSRKSVMNIPNSWIGRYSGQSKFKIAKLILPYLRALSKSITF
jgi:dolichol-phosphate mannosyltransferase